MNVIKKVLKTANLSRPINNLINSMPEPVQRLAVKLGAKTELVPLDILPDKYKEALGMVSAQRNGRELGDYLEFGVYQGSSMTCMYRAATALGLDQMRFIGFDSFDGMPEQANYEDENAWRAGEYRSSLSYTKEYLNYQGVDMSRVSLIKGWFDDTCNPATVQQHNIQKAAVINIDCDIYSSTKTALEFCKPFIQDDIVIFFDDWNSHGMADKSMGERKAFEEFLASNQQFSARELKHLSYNENSTAFYLQVNSIS